MNWKDELDWGRKILGNGRYPQQGKQNGQKDKGGHGCGKYRELHKVVCRESRMLRWSKRVEAL